MGALSGGLRAGTELRRVYQPRLWILRVTRRGRTSCNTQGIVVQNESHSNGQSRAGYCSCKVHRNFPHTASGCRSSGSRDTLRLELRPSLPLGFRHSRSCLRTPRPTPAGCCAAFRWGCMACQERPGFLQTTNRRVETLQNCVEVHLWIIERRGLVKTHCSAIAARPRRLLVLSDLRAPAALHVQKFSEN